MYMVDHDELLEDYGIRAKQGREYAIVGGCCSACESTERVLPGHFACAPYHVPRGWKSEDMILDGWGWRHILSRIPVVHPKKHARRNCIYRPALVQTT